MHRLYSRQIALLSFVVVGIGINLSSHAIAAEPPQIAVDEIRVISWKPPLYHGWPTLTRRSSGELLLAFSGGRESSVCPFGRLEMMRSKDQGRTWGWPQVIYDCPIDDRDASVIETSQGSILLTNFTSLLYAKDLEAAEKMPAGHRDSWDAVKLAEWQAAHGRLNALERQREVGNWMWRSQDGGVTWSARYAVPCNCPHGPIALKDFRLLYLGVGDWEGHSNAAAWESTDDGRTWKPLGKIPTRPEDNLQNYCELHVVETDRRQLITHIHNRNPRNGGEILQSESNDGGSSWSVPHSIGVWGHPPHLLKLRDGRLLLTYGHCQAPFGNQVRIGDTEGVNWSKPITISDDAVNEEVGFPSTIECDDGTLVTVWYERLKASEFAQLRQARWRILK